jgi:hypothetical protein
VIVSTPLTKKESASIEHIIWVCNLPCLPGYPHKITTTKEEPVMHLSGKKIGMQRSYQVPSNTWCYCGYEEGLLEEGDSCTCAYSTVLVTKKTLSIVPGPLAPAYYTAAATAARAASIAAESRRAANRAKQTAEFVAAKLVADELVAAELVAAELVAAELVAAELVAAELVAAELVAAELVAADFRLLKRLQAPAQTKRLKWATELVAWEPLQQPEVAAELAASSAASSAAFSAAAELEAAGAAPAQNTLGTFFKVLGGVAPHHFHIGTKGEIVSSRHLTPKQVSAIEKRLGCWHDLSGVAYKLDVTRVACIMRTSGERKGTVRAVQKWIRLVPGPYTHAFAARAALADAKALAAKRADARHGYRVKLRTEMRAKVTLTLQTCGLLPGPGPSWTWKQVKTAVATDFAKRQVVANNGQLLVCPFEWYKAHAKAEALALAFAHAKAEALALAEEKQYWCDRCNHKNCWRTNCEWSDCAYDSDSDQSAEE